MLKEFRSIDVYWDKATRRIYGEIRSSSSDEKGRKLTVQVVNDGQIQDLTNVDLNLYWETQDGENKGLDPFTALDPENGIYELYFRRGMLQHVGKLNAHLRLVDTTGAITSEPFTIFVFEGINVDAMASDDELSALNKALVEVQTIKQDFVNESNQLIATEKAELDALQLDYANRAETLETTYAPRLNAVEQNIDLSKIRFYQNANLKSQYAAMRDGEVRVVYAWNVTKAQGWPLDESTRNACLLIRVSDDYGLAIATSGYIGQWYPSDAEFLWH